MAHTPPRLNRIWKEGQQCDLCVYFCGKLLSGDLPAGWAMLGVSLPHPLKDYLSSGIIS